MRSKLLGHATFTIVAVLALHISWGGIALAEGNCPDGMYMATQPGDIEVCLKIPTSNKASAQSGDPAGLNNSYPYGMNNGDPRGLSNPRLNSGGTGGGEQLMNPLGEGNDSLEAFLRSVIAILRIFAIPIIVFMIIYAGFLYVLARGNEEQVTKATRALTYAVVGGLLIIGAELILSVIQGTVNQLTP